MEKRVRMRWTGLALIAVGVTVPRLIDWYETVNRLDIKRDVGVLPWVILGAVGFAVVVASFRRGRREGSG